ncbi:YbbR-like domain-containing protein [Bizionia saleffrena]|uniref:YbbR-like domain-containing protein n=1 Tax=Bizionia saleffrena TaxID=291189 RepID=A0A8H2LET2_9FLAO|nr:CdaR family protein [Bizionia saleffrena]TYB77366.1 YbbR-like domain-containing protein [Bizionia saleffrena]
MTTLKSKILTVIKTRKINIFFLFFILAFAILVLTKLSKTYTDTIAFTVLPKNIPDEVIILNDSSHQLKVTLKAQGFKWLKYYLKQPYLSIDFNTDVNKADSTYVWMRTKGFSNLIEQFSKEIEIESINPETLTFYFDENAVKYVPVRPQMTIAYAPGYDVMEEESTTPDSIKVIGPESLLRELEFIKTHNIELTNINKPVHQILKLNLDSLNTKMSVSQKEVLLALDVKKFTEGTKEIPVEVINVPKDLTLKFFPKSIYVSYYTSLENFNAIKKTDFQIICNYKDLKETSTFLTPILTKRSEKAKSIRLHHEKVEFIITE